MAEHKTVERVSGLYYQVRNGCIEREEQGEKLCFEAVSGRLASLRLFLDEGNQQAHVDPYVALEVHLDDDDALFVKIRFASVAGWTFAQRIGAIRKGQLVRLRAAPGDNPKVSFVYVDTPDENGEWKLAPKIEFPPSEREQQAEACVRAHEAFKKACEGEVEAEECQSEFFGIAIQSYGMPPYDADPELYLSMMRRALKDESMVDLSRVSPDQWRTLASELIDRFPHEARWPKEFRQRAFESRSRAKDDEYDPFADEASA